MLRRWWVKAKSRLVEVTGMAPARGAVMMLLTAVLLVILIAYAAVAPGILTAREAASLNGSLGENWQCSYVPNAQDICFRKTPALPARQ